MPDTNNSETVLIAENVSTAALTPGYPLQHKLAVQSHSNSTDPSGCYSGTGEEGKYGDSLLLTFKSSLTKTFIRQFITIFCFHCHIMRYHKLSLSTSKIMF